MSLALLSWCICISWRKQYIERMEKEQMWWSMDHMRILWQHSEQLHYSLSAWLLIGWYCADQHSNSLLWFKMYRKTWDCYTGLSKLVFFPFIISINLFPILWLQPWCDLGKKVVLIREEHWSLYFEIHWGEVIKFSNQTSWVG